jgi:hypothetical protein
LFRGGGRRPVDNFELRGFGGYPPHPLLWVEVLGEHAHRNASGTAIAQWAVNDPLASAEPGDGKGIMKLLGILTTQLSKDFTLEFPG